MARSSWFRNLGKIIATADFCDRRRLSTREGMEEFNARGAQYRVNRREFLASAGKLAAIGAAGMGMDPLSRAIAAPPATRAPIKVAIVGAGLAGLACAYELKRKGLTATLFDANERVGGRCWSLRDFFPGQVAERGGEFIDTPHKTLLGYVKEFKLAVEDVDKQPGEVFYYFNGQHYPESRVVDEYRALVPAMRSDLHKLSKEPTAANHTAADVVLDQTSLAAYLDSRGAGPLIKAVIEQAYKAEYGLEIDEQSCLSFLLFIHADRRSKFTPFGVFSDERYHVLDGNDRITRGLSDRLPGQIELDMRLVRALKTAAGKIELSFAQGASIKQATFDAVVLALPFTTLREVDLDASLDLPRWKIDAIELLGYGTNAKMMVGFDHRPWISLGGNGEAYSDLTHHQLSWETNPLRASAGHGVLTDYSSGQRGASLNPDDPQTEASRFLNDLDDIFPGALAAATRDANGLFRVHLEHWPSNPLSQGSYTCYRPGQFTSIAGNEGTPVGNLYFAGEHANSFYDWQGFMEGAALSGIQAAKEILQDIKTGQLS
jgi:monoamine oxidase